MKKLVVLMSVLIISIINMGYFVSAETDENIYVLNSLEVLSVDIDEVDVYFAIVEPILENGVLTEIDNKLYFEFSDYNFYLPGGTLGKLDNMLEYINDEFQGYTYIVLIIINVSSNYLFEYYSTESERFFTVAGVSYILYDKPDGAVRFYNYMSQRVWNLAFLRNLNDVRFYVPVEEVAGSYNEGFNDGYNEGYTEGYNGGYNVGFNDGIKSITNKPIATLLKWTVPFVTLIIISGIYLEYRRKWFNNG